MLKSTRFEMHAGTYVTIFFKGAMKQNH